MTPTKQSISNIKDGVAKGKINNISKWKHYDYWFKFFGNIKDIEKLMKKSYLYFNLINNDTNQTNDE